MDAAQIAAMIADREAGTPGAFEVVTNRHNHHGKIEVLGPSVGILGFTIATDVSLEDAKTIRADMRRIARVPDMESTIIAQAAELERLRAALDVSDKYWRGENITPFEVILAIRAALEAKP